MSLGHLRELLRSYFFVFIIFFKKLYFLFLMSLENRELGTSVVRETEPDALKGEHGTSHRARRGVEMGLCPHC